MKITSAARVMAGALTALVIGTGAVQAQPSDTARYLVTFDSEWTSTNHPVSFPPGAHFSPLVGVSHNASASFWEFGEIASPGIELMAETGGDSTLLGEYQAQMALGNARETFGGRAPITPGETTAIFKASVDHPLVTLVTMIAPSPDWFVGVSGLPLMEGGDWADEIVVDLAPLDSGTDSGTTYLSPNQDTNPPEPIFEITGFPFLNGGQVHRIGTITFTRIEDDCLTLNADELVAGGSATIEVTGGVPGEAAVVLWGAEDGITQIEIEELCASLEFVAPTDLPELTGRLIVRGLFDSNGNFVRTINVPGGLAGRDYFLQTGTTGSCPDSCISNRVEGTIQ